MGKLDLTRYDAAVAKMMALMGMDGAGEAMLAASVATPKYFFLGRCLYDNREKQQSYSTSVCDIRGLYCYIR